MTRPLPRKTERNGTCEVCGYEGMTDVWRGQRLCRNCLMGDEIPLRLEDYVTGTCPLGDTSRMGGETPRGLAAGGAFDRALIKGMKKNGWHWTRDQEMSLMYSGAEETRARKLKLWDREFEGEV